MRHFYDLGGWLSTSLGIALLVCSLFLVPRGHVLAQGGEPYGCTGNLCDSGCTGCPVPAQGNVCVAVGGCNCTANPGPGNTCDTCACRPNSERTACGCTL
jgi:hypothetical protein